MNLSEQGKGLLGGLTPAEMTLILAIARRDAFDVDQLILQEGQPHDSLYLVEEGLLHVQRKSDDRAVFLGRISAGSCVGEVGFFLRRPATATVRAASKGFLYEIRRSEFDRLLLEQPALGCKILRAVLEQLGDRLSHADERLVDAICWDTWSP